MIELALLAAIGILIVGAMAAFSVLGLVLDLVLWILFLPFRLLAAVILVPILILKFVVGALLAILAVPVLAIVALAVVAVLIPLLPLLLLGLLLWAAFKLLQAMMGFAAV